MSIKLKVPSDKVNGNYLGFEFVNGVAEVEDEIRARQIANQLNYEIIEEEEEEEAKKEAPKKAASKAKAKKEDKE